MVQIVWFKRDLRTFDHTPLALAAASGDSVLPLYVAEPAYWALPDTSRRQWLAIRPALEELRHRLAALGAPLIVRMGDVVEVLRRIHRAIGITRLLAHEETGNGWTFARDLAVQRFCREAGIDFVEVQQFGVVRRLRDRDRWGSFHRAFLDGPVMDEPPALQPATAAIGPIPTADQLGLGDDGCPQPQSGTRADGQALLSSFFAGRGAGYRRDMSSPLAGETSCSRLSVPLSTGAISIREVFKRCFAERTALAAVPPELRAVPLTAIDSLVARLHWHCHFIQKLESEPPMETRSLHPVHERARRFTAPEDPQLQAWAQGRTGYPFLDACMRSLVATGWLNFRMRAMVEAFAHYHLGLDWRASGLVLARLFTDYEPGIHWSQVQMQAGQTGINTPRIYNPVKQGQDQDGAGTFTRRWVPELAHVPAALLQEPWLMDKSAQDAAGCVIGRDYPAPLVEHGEAVRAARARLTALRADPDYRPAASSVFVRHGSRKSRDRREGGRDTLMNAKAGSPPAKPPRAKKPKAASRQLALDL